MKTAIILGATGLVGGVLLEKLLADARYRNILVFGRKTCGVSHPKLQEHLVDLFHLKDYKSLFVGDVVFCCIGTTKAKTPDHHKYKKIDYGIPVDAAKLCNLNGISSYLAISALGADPNSSVFYNTVKGDMEEKVLAQNIPHVYLLQPSLISGDRKENRTMETIGNWVMKIVNPLLVGRLKKYRSIHPETIANAMIWLDNNNYNLKRIPSDIIKTLGR
ncbi:nucleoside-diphosphate sugar epimerase [Mariniflexile ostreae]|uniref:Nucleoside-diphosphate sugar epimerase n=1 Tax=Mariniflexile ostreae TaxID=1520892 RepID=A0ABV5FCK0_9FLAO